MELFLICNGIWNYVYFVIPVELYFCLLFLICAEMTTRSLLRADVDAKHRGKRWEDGEKLEPLMLRTPKSNWMIHPAWHQRYVSSLQIQLHVFLCDD